MSQDLPIERRSFLAGTAGVLASGVLHEMAEAKEPSNETLIAKGYGRPAAKVNLPTDRLPEPDGPKKRIVALTTAWFKYSHADDIITKFIEGYEILGRLHQPHAKVVGLYVEQFPETDISRGMAARYHIPLFKTPAEALTLGRQRAGGGCRAPHRRAWGLPGECQGPETLSPPAVVRGDRQSLPGVGAQRAGL